MNNCKTQTHLITKLAELQVICITYIPLLGIFYTVRHIKENKLLKVPLFYRKWIAAVLIHNHLLNISLTR